MHPVVNTEQAQAWNGYEGDHWAGHHDRWNAVNGGFDEPLFTAAAIGPRDHVLDIGCGAGRTTRLAARQAADGRALGIDLSAPMLARARAEAAGEGLANAAFVQGDAQVHPFAPAAFDVAVSRFATMFFGDPVAAFANIRGALRPGGRLAFVCMGDPGRNDWLRVLTALGEHLPVPPPPTPGDPGMFSLADPGRVRAVLAGAGYASISATAVEAPMHWGRDAADAARFLLGSGPAHHLLAGAGRATARRAEDTLTAALRPHAGPAGVRLRGAALVVTAVAP
ncbi:class I SAM-dependent methyltransferase [Kitasatospora indigofera]|uniref:class I SAM-dependent methyltransferase n=1 Tax=Kitasatospora indigofera TaxID=67307 RepID=UPI003245B1B7